MRFYILLLLLFLGSNAWAKSIEDTLRIHPYKETDMTQDSPLHKDKICYSENTSQGYLNQYENFRGLLLKNEKNLKKIFFADHLVQKIFSIKIPTSTKVIPTHDKNFIAVEKNNQTFIYTYDGIIKLGNDYHIVTKKELQSYGLSTENNFAFSQHLILKKNDTYYMINKKWKVVYQGNHLPIFINQNGELISVFKNKKESFIQYKQDKNKITLPFKVDLAPNEKFSVYSYHGTVLIYFFQKDNNVNTLSLRLDTRSNQLKETEKTSYSIDGALFYTNSPVTEINQNSIWFFKRDNIKKELGLSRKDFYVSEELKLIFIPLNNRLRAYRLNSFNPDDLESNIEFELKGKKYYNSTVSDNFRVLIIDNYLYSLKVNPDKSYSLIGTPVKLPLKDFDDIEIKDLYNKRKIGLTFYFNMKKDNTYVYDIKNKTFSLIENKDFENTQQKISFKGQEIYQIEYKCIQPRVKIGPSNKNNFSLTNFHTTDESFIVSEEHFIQAMHNDYHFLKEYSVKNLYELAILAKDIKDSKKKLSIYKKIDFYLRLDNEYEKTHKKKLNDFLMQIGLNFSNSTFGFQSFMDISQFIHFFPYKNITAHSVDSLIEALLEAKPLFRSEKDFKGQVEKIIEKIEEHVIKDKEFKGIFSSKLYYIVKSYFYDRLGYKSDILIDPARQRSPELKTLRIKVLSSRKIQKGTRSKYGFYYKNVDFNLKNGTFDKDIFITTSGKKYKINAKGKLLLPLRELIDKSSKPNLDELWREGILSGVIIFGSNSETEEEKRYSQGYINYLSKQGFKIHTSERRANTKNYLRQLIIDGQLDYMIKEAHSDSDEQNLFRLNKWSTVVLAEKKDPEKGNEVIHILTKTYKKGRNETDLLSNKEFASWMQFRKKVGGSRFYFLNTSCRSYRKAIAEYEAIASASDNVTIIASGQNTKFFTSSPTNDLNILFSSFRSGRSYKQMRALMEASDVAEYIFPGSSQYQDLVVNSLLKPVEMNIRIFNPQGKELFVDQMND